MSRRGVKRPRGSSPSASSRQQHSSPPTTPASGSSRRRGGGRGDPSSDNAPPSSDNNPEGDADGDEAMEDPEAMAEQDEPERVENEEEDDGEELIGDTMGEDYRRIEHLDRYDPNLVDQRDYADMEPEDRMAAERALEERDAERARREGRVPAALRADDDDEGEIRRKRPRRSLADPMTGAMGAADDEPMEDDGNMQTVNLEDYKGPIREYIVRDQPRRELAHRFRSFLTTYVDKSGHNVYGERIRQMAGANRESLEVSYIHLIGIVDLLAVWVAEYPTEMLQIFDDVAMDVTLSLFPEYRNIHTEIHVRITDLPIEDTLRDLRQVHMNALVKVSGVVTRRSSVYPQLKSVKYDCSKCGFLMGPYIVNDINTFRTPSCVQCQSKGPFTVNTEQTIYRNYQKLTLQETPGTVPPGRLPRYKEVILLADLIDSARPGEEIEVVGIYKNTFDSSLNYQNGFPVFSTAIEANFVSKKDDAFAAFRLTDEDVKQIRALARDERIADKVIRSIAPSIYGHDDVRTAIALALFGGEPKEKNGHKIRGDVNVLILGDPGTAKSQFLKYVEKTAHRAVFTTGQGASAVGLTAAVHRDPMTREWTLEGGALVLADQGVCMIDEFDKMNDQDRTSIHEAMEQQSISISKAGIVATLQARCSVIAAANPLKGRYDATVPFNMNVALTEPILSRFDLLLVVRDTIDPVADERLATFVVDSHDKATAYAIRTARGDDAPEEEAAAAVPDGTIPQDLLRKYIVFAKQNIHPKITNIDERKLETLYATIRRESQNNTGVPITVRQIESIIRIAEAYARMHLRDFVRDDDVNMAIRVVLESFIGAQKYQVEKSLYKTFQKYLVYKKDNNELVYYVLLGLMRDQEAYNRSMGQASQRVEIFIDDLEQRARELSIHDLNPFYESNMFLSNGFTVDREQSKIVKTFQAF